MIHISRVRIELPHEVIIHCDTTTNESIDQYKARINADLLRYNIKATIDITSGETTPSQFTERTLRPHIGKKVMTKLGPGELVEAIEAENRPVDDMIRIKTDNGRNITMPASQVLEIVEG